MVDSISTKQFPIKKQTDIHAENRKAVDQVAKSMESQFAKLLLERMNNTIGKVNPGGSATQFYETMLRDQYAKIMTDKNQGLGLQKMIREDLYRRMNIPSQQQTQAKQDISIKKYQKESNNDKR